MFGMGTNIESQHAGDLRFAWTHGPAKGLLVISTCLGSVCAQIDLARAADPILIPLQHVADEDGDDGDDAPAAGDDGTSDDGDSDASDDEDDSASDDEDGDDDEVGYDRLGIMVGINDSEPRLYEFDTGSDELNAEIDSNIPGVKPVRGSKPEMYAYGNGTYGDWVQQVQFGSLSYYDPDDPSEPVATFDGGYGAGQVVDYVYTKDYDGFEDLNVTQKPVGRSGGEPVYADLDARQKMQNGEPADEPPLYGIFGAGNFIDEGDHTTAPGSQTQSGYVISANANLGEDTTPGCAPCLILNLTPNLRSQFTALTPWGKMDYQGYQKKFPHSGANTSTQFEGSYSYTISFDDDNGDRQSVDFESSILFDSGTPNFLYPTQRNVITTLKDKGFDLEEDSDSDVGFSLYGFDDGMNNLDYDDVDISRLSNEDEGGDVVLGLPFFHLNTIMYDLENRMTAYSPYFVSVDNFATGAADEDVMQLSHVTSDMGSYGWLGLAGVISGDNSFVVEAGGVVRMTNANTYTGATYIETSGFLSLAGTGSIEQSSSVVVNGVLDISQKGNHLKQWGVPDSQNDAVFRSLSGTGEIHLGARRLVLTDADGRFEGAITDYEGSIADYGDSDENLGGGLVLNGGKLTLSGENDYSGLTEVAAGAELHVSGSLTGDVSVSGLLVVDGEVSGNVTVKEGGTLTGSGTVGNVTNEGGQAELMSVDQ